MTEEDFIQTYRQFLKDGIRKVIDFSQTDQSKRIAPPPIEKPYSLEAKRIDLLKYDQFMDIGEICLREAIKNRESRRAYSRQSLSLEELSFLLWATQGVRKKMDSGHALRTVPSAGCRHRSSRPARRHRRPHPAGRRPPGSG